MRIVFTVQRYGEEIAGGAEQHCRWLAESLVARGHDVHVVTSRALDYMTWKDHHPAGDSDVNGVSVHRFDVERTRDIARFNRIAEQIDFLNHTTPRALERLWLREQGPSLVGARSWLRANAPDFDVAIPFTYLYATSQIATESLHGRLPIVMHATAHDEFPFHLRLIGEELSMVDEFLCSTPEEEALIQRRLGGRATTHVVGIGVDLVKPGDRSETLRRLDLPVDPYFVVLGRIDPSKGVDAAAEMFSRWRSERSRPVNLVAIGGRSSAYDGLEFGDGVFSTGFVDETTKSTLLHGAIGLIQPSPYESFSLALCEGWLAGIPSLSTKVSDVLAGQTERSGAGLLYDDEKEYAVGLTTLADDRALAMQLGENGRRFVKDNFVSADVVTRIERILVEAARKFDRSGSGPTNPS